MGWVAHRETMMLMGMILGFLVWPSPLSHLPGFLSCTFISKYGLQEMFCGYLNEWERCEEVERQMGFCLVSHQ